MRVWLRLMATAWFPLLALAHVGSPDVFFEGNAGPYRMLVVVRTPRAIPGVADIEVRPLSSIPRTVRMVPLRIRGLGSELAPVPDIAKRDSREPNVFRGELWIMLGGAWKVRIEADGDQGAGEISVPIAAVSANANGMQRPLKWLLSVLLIVLSAGLVGVAGAAAREGMNAPGQRPSLTARRRGRLVMLITVAIVVGLLWGGRAWWGLEAGVIADRVYKTPLLRVAPSGPTALSLAIQNMRKPAETIELDDLVPDHGHLMHLFLLRVPALDRMFHLHPEQQGNSFVQHLPSLPGGRYQVFADIVHASGFPETAIGEITLPDIQSAPFDQDDSSAAAEPVDKIAGADSVAMLVGGGRVVRLGRATLIAGEATWLQFLVESAPGEPATDLEPYMGMPAHLVIVREDLTVFAHLHPSGSPPMATIELANGSTMSHHSGHTMPVSPDLAFPYGFPQAGIYRLFVQIKRAGKIQTGVFDVTVADAAKTPG